jgi:predicted transcriptional regulator
VRAWPAPEGNDGSGGQANVTGTGRRQAGTLEREIVDVLAAGGRPMTAQQVLVELGRPLAYTTVATTLARLCEKGATSRGPRTGRSTSYTLSGDARQIAAALTARQMRRLLDAEADRAAALARFVDGLTPADEQILTRLLRSGPAPTPPRPSRSPRPPRSSRRARQRDG